MTLVQFEAFLAVISSGSFTRAASNLNMTQSAVSQTIASLEFDLGVKLFSRSKSGVKLTPIGERMHGHINEIAYRIRCMTEEANTAAGISTSVLRIGWVPTQAVSFVPSLLAAFQMNFRDVRLILIEGTQHEVERWISDAVVDIGVCTIVEERIAPIDYVAVASNRLMVLFSDSHAFSQKSDVSLEEVHEETLAVVTGEIANRVNEVFYQNGRIPNFHFEVKDSATVLSLVQTGLAITMMPEYGIPYGLHGVSMLPVASAPMQILGLGVKSMQSVTPSVADFILSAQAVFRIQ